ncbi:hypothetical protein [Sphingomonas corticis]|jgi:hypothetical protein|uniref:Uncharacterized protein n=1 Tax=Sphingomonas corticis TaxID=2722791 RepID=A0ABX1CQZ5_9SPHN|nr:hypothetical protein [Sphingomonas corticis]NJR78440.1 hypothetical protein [Sphingomonas corticis]
MRNDRSRGAPLAWGLAAAAAAATIAWFASRGRQEGVDARTRDRLAPPAAAPRVPSAADIHVA